MRSAAPRPVRLVAACVLSVAALSSSSGLAADYQEYEVKAAFLLNFARLTEWPAAASPAPGAALVVGVRGDAGVRRALERALADASVKGHPVEIRSLDGPGQLAGCHLVFLSASENAAAWLAEARARPVLSVGESPGFAERGGVVNFFLEESKLRFEINLGAAERHGLKVSSKLLRLARLVGERSR